MAEEFYNFKDIESKWQKQWEETKAWQVTNEAEGKKMYVLDMFPYPSGDGLHVGHAKIYTASDIVSRYLRMRGYAVLHPTGWDAFGLPTENSAIKLKMHPEELTKRNVDRFRGQMKRLGLSYDWEREITTTDPAYYKWTQWIFLQLYRMGLAYEATIPINWCPSCKTGLANEEVVDGKCERCGTPVTQKPMRQWLLKITRYAEHLLQGLTGLDWPESILDMQRNWIGKSIGAIISFPIENASLQMSEAQSAAPTTIDVFTTRADTLYGVTYVVLAPEHPAVTTLTHPEQAAAVAAYQSNVLQRNERERLDASTTKTGVFTGGYVMHPLTNKRLPVWVADYVIGSYGMGAVMAVPAHDERDWQFATKYDLPIVDVVEPIDSHRAEKLPYTGEGVLVNSATHSGQTSAVAQEAIVGQLQMTGRGRTAVTYKLRDWVFSRQRYWGEPIPLIHCQKCGVVPVPEEELPVRLPDIERYEPTGTGESPLAAIEEWVNVKCPTCPAMARRETNTMPQWAGSSWYFLRFADPHNGEALASVEALRKWMPVDVYVGGAEHAVLHLLYARFWALALHDAGLVPGREPFARLRSVGLVRGEDGQKMSKSRGNVINPDDVIAQYGADTLRLYSMFMGPFEASVAWDTSSIAGVHRFLHRVWKMVTTIELTSEPAAGDILVALQRTIKRVTEGTEKFKFNTAIASLMELLNVLEKKMTLPTEVIENYLILLAPYAPHMVEELWSGLGRVGGVGKATWPHYSVDILAKVEKVIAVQVNGKIRSTLTMPPAVGQSVVEQQARLEENVARHLTNQEIVKVIFVPNRLINFVTRQPSEPAK